MKKYQCHYHRNVTAQTKCPQCGKKICLDCAQKNGACPECHHRNVDKQYGKVMEDRRQILHAGFAGLQPKQRIQHVVIAV